MSDQDIPLYTPPERRPVDWRTLPLAVSILQAIEAHLGRSVGECEVYATAQEYLSVSVMWDEPAGGPSVTIQGPV
jgi:hypothetical protein